MQINDRLNPVEYRVAELQPVINGNILFDPAHEILERIIQCVDVEGPIHQNLLNQRVAAAWGISKVGRLIRERIEEQTNLAVREKWIHRSGNFLSQTARFDPVIRRTSGNEKPREIDHVSPEEIRLAIEHVLHESSPLMEEYLATQVARALGYLKTGSRIRKKLRDVIHTSKANGFLEQTDSGYRLHQR